MGESTMGNISHKVSGFDRINENAFTRIPVEG